MTAGSPPLDADPARPAPSPAQRSFTALADGDVAAAGLALADALRGSRLDAAPSGDDAFGRRSRLDTLLELDEDVWWSGSPQAAADLVADAVAVAAEQGGDLAAVVALYVREVCFAAWDLTWDHRSILHLIRSTTAALDACSQTSAADRIAGAVLAGLAADLRIETGTTTAMCRSMAAAARAAERHWAGVDADLEVNRGRLDPDFERFVGELLSRRRPYCVALAVTAEAMAAFFAGESGASALLDEALVVLTAAEEVQTDLGDEDARSELASQRAVVTELLAHREAHWLHVDRGSVVAIYPFGLRHMDYRAVVAHVKTHADRWTLAGHRQDNNPTQLLLVDDVWRGGDSLNRRYEGTQLDLDPVRIRDLDTGVDRVGQVSVVLSELGNHQVRVSFEIEDAGPQTLAALTWLAAPEFGDLEELADTSGAATEPQVRGASGRTWARLCDYAGEVARDVPRNLNADLAREAIDGRQRAEDVELSARPGMYHVVTTLTRASQQPGPAGASQRQPLAHAEELLGLFGIQALLHPIPSGVGAMASWAEYPQVGTRIRTDALVGDLLVTTANHTVLASFHDPTYMVRSVQQGVEFVASLEGLFTAWQDDLSHHSDVLRAQVDAFAEVLADPALAPDTEGILEQLEAAQIDLRRFTSRVRLSLLFVLSPSLVTSPVMRRTIDDLLATSVVWQRRGEYTQVADQVLGDRLSDLIAAWRRRREEEIVAMQERSRWMMDTLLAVIAGIGVSGIVAIVQAGFGIEGAGAAVLAVIVGVLSAVCGIVFFLLGRRYHRKPRRPPSMGDPE